MRALIEAGAEINALDDEERQPLHFAARSNPAAVPVLLAANAEVNILNRWNKSPLFLAAVNNQPECVVALCKARADPHLGNSPLTLTDLEVPDKEIRDQIRSLSN